RTSPARTLTICGRRLLAALTFFFFFFQAEDGIRDFHVTGVQTCALPICPLIVNRLDYHTAGGHTFGVGIQILEHGAFDVTEIERSEERRVGKECRCWWAPYP